MITEEIKDTTPMPFGQYKGTRLIDVPASHLIWLYDNERAGRLKAYISSNMQALIKEAAKERRRK